MGYDRIRKIVAQHESGEIQVFIHPNCLAEAYKVISLLQSAKSENENRDQNIKAENVVRSAYATLSVLQNENVTMKLGSLRLKYREKPWGDLSSAALASHLSNQGDGTVPVVILDRERHFEDIEEVRSVRVSQLEP